jgi:hypothetical protein
LSHVRAAFRRRNVFQCLIKVAGQEVGEMNQLFYFLAFQLFNDFRRFFLVVTTGRKHH